MALADAAKQVDEKKTTRGCGLGRILSTLTSEDVKFYNQMREGGATRTYIAEVFKADGHDVSVFTVSRHIKGECSCR